MNKKFMAGLLLASGIGLQGCAQPPVQAPLATIPNRQQEVTKITLGGVQANLKKGAPSSVVIETLGSPNIISSNADGSETWVYDKISTEVEYSVGATTGVATKSTRTMMVVVKFDKNKSIDDVKYRQTSY